MLWWLYLRLCTGRKGVNRRAPCGVHPENRTLDVALLEQADVRTQVKTSVLPGRIGGVEGVSNQRYDGVVQTLLGQRIAVLNHELLFWSLRNGHLRCCQEVGTQARRINGTNHKIGWTVRRWARIRRS